MQLPETLAGWLALLEARHGQTVRLGLARVAGVAARIALEPQCPVITVGGTNGKGSTCAMLEAILQAAGYRVGLYSSPHLLRYNERVRIDGREADDEALVRAMEQVEIARGDTPLTYFEHGTLAALAVFREAAPDVVILEVGLGGRLDAVNVIDSDCAIVTSVALDHMDFLGQDREAIGFEKAGIFRAGKPAICADPEPPASLVAHAGEIGAGVVGVGLIEPRREWQKIPADQLFVQGEHAGDVGRGFAGELGSRPRGIGTHRHGDLGDAHIGVQLLITVDGGSKGLAHAGVQKPVADLNLNEVRVSPAKEPDADMPGGAGEYDRENDHREPVAKSSGVHGVVAIRARASSASRRAVWARASRGWASTKAR